MKPVDLEQLDALIRPVVESQGYELVDLAWVREYGRAIFRIMIDRQPGQGAISLDDCSRVSHEVSVLLDVHDTLPGKYHLEVSSPGENRPLKRLVDFARFVGKRAKIRLQPQEGQPRQSLLGILQGVQDDQVGIQVEDTKQMVWISKESIEKAHLLEEFRGVKRHS